MLQNERGWTIVIDDYVNRPQYKVIADFAEIERYVGGRIAVLNALKAINREQLEIAISQYETAPD
jgi:hypothetical protein